MIESSNLYLKSHEIKITDIKNIQIGQVEDTEAATGCTVIISKNGAPTGLDVRGGGPASRESELLKPVANAKAIHAVVLGGGSAFGLNAAGGVMQYLEEHNIGFDVGITKVPLVCQSDIFDLTVGKSDVRPDCRMGYEACVAAENGNYRDGCFGAGTGASVGKLQGMATAMKSGIGSFAVRIGELEVGAIVVVNALGDIFDYSTNTKVAGMLTPDKKGFADSSQLIYEQYNKYNADFAANTTIGIVITNAAFDKTALCKIASMSHNGYSRSIRPVNTSADGDSIYAMSAGSVNADIDTVGSLAAEVMSEAILTAVNSATSCYGLVAAKDL